MYTALVYIPCVCAHVYCSSVHMCIYSPGVIMHTGIYNPDPCVNITIFFVSIKRNIKYEKL